MLVHVGVVVMFCVVRVPLLMRGYGGVLVNGTGIGGAFSVVTRAIANALHASDRDTHEPQQRARPRENAEQGTNFRLSRNFQFQSIVFGRPCGRYGVFTSCEILFFQR